MMLYVVRHAIAEDAPPGGTDAGRRLTPAGRRKMEGVVRGLRVLEVEPDAVITSPLVRAVETARIVVAGLRGAPEPRELEALEPDVAPADTLRGLRPFGRSQHAMIVGHEPNLSSVLALLLTGAPGGAAIELKKGACAAVEVSAFEPGGGATLRWLLPPRALRRIGG
jgi:phosphohistidine phosphatase